MSDSSNVHSAGVETKPEEPLQNPLNAISVILRKALLLPLSDTNLLVLGFLASLPLSFQLRSFLRTNIPTETNSPAPAVSITFITILLIIGLISLALWLFLFIVGVVMKAGINIYLKDKLPSLDEIVKLTKLERPVLSLSDIWQTIKLYWEKGRSRFWQTLLNRLAIGILDLLSIVGLIIIVGLPLGILGFIAYKAGMRLELVITVSAILGVLPLLGLSIIVSIILTVLSGVSLVLVALGRAGPVESIILAFKHLCSQPLFWGLTSLTIWFISLAVVIAQSVVLMPCICTATSSIVGIIASLASANIDIVSNPVVLIPFFIVSIALCIVINILSSPFWAYLGAVTNTMWYSSSLVTGIIE